MNWSARFRFSGVDDCESVNDDAAVLCEIHIRPAPGRWGASTDAGGHGVDGAREAALRLAMGRRARERQSAPAALPAGGQLLVDRDDLVLDGDVAAVREVLENAADHLAGCAHPAGD